MPGRSDRSYGIQVARLAGLPREVIARAREILGALERDELTRGGRPSVSGTDVRSAAAARRCSRRRRPTMAAQQARARSIVDRMTPIEALTLLAELKNTL